MMIIITKKNHKQQKKNLILNFLNLALNQKEEIKFKLLMIYQRKKIRIIYLIKILKKIRIIYLIKILKKIRIIYLINYVR